LLREGTAANQVSQGITTLMVGPTATAHGRSPSNLAKLNGKVAVNVGSFIGHAEVRTQVMVGDYKRMATTEEIGTMAKLVDRAIEAKALSVCRQAWSMTRATCRQPKN
jgi:N-acyl-D-aspartate/D-glutamate deacylase